MKRSEMVEIIQDYLSECVVNSDHSSESQADLLLTILENYGMLPPNKWEPGERLSGHIEERDFVWEPEEG